MAYTKEAFLLASANVLKAAFDVDKAIAKTAATVNDWAKQAVDGITAKAITIDDVKAQLIADYRLTLPKKQAEEFDVDTAKIGDCGNTIKGWFYALQRIVKAGDTVMARVSKGEAFNTVARDTKPVQEQTSKAGKSGAPKGEAKPATLAIALTSLHYHLDGAIANGERAAELATNPQIVAILGKLAQLEKAAATYTAKATAKKAA